MFSASQQVADNHESNQDARISAVEGGSTASDARLTALETKTKHQSLADEGTGDERHKHGRRLEATDKITVDSTADLADATFEAIAHSTNVASLVLKRATATTTLTHGTPSGFGTETHLVVNATGNTADDKSILTAVHGSGEMTLGEGTSTISMKTLVAEVVGPASSNATVAVASGGNTNDAVLDLKHASTGNGFRLVSAGAGNELLTYRDNAGTPLLLESRGATGGINRPNCPEIRSVVPTGNLIREDRVSTSTASVTHQRRVGSTGTSGFDTVVDVDWYAVKRVTGGSSITGLAVNRSTGAITLGGATSVGGNFVVSGTSDVLGDSQVRRVFFRQTNNNKIEFIAGGTIGGAFTAPIRMFDNANSTIRIGGGGASSLVECHSLSQTSDRTLKEDIRPIENPGRLLQIEPVSWLWKRAEGEADDTPRHRTSGVIAQDVEAVCPEAVRTNSEGIKTIEYRCLTALLIAHVKELTARVAALEAGSN